MDDWITGFGSLDSSGVHCLLPGVDEAGLRDAAALHGFDFTRIDLGQVNGKTGFLAGVARALGFPAYFGMNWDALHECLTDMSWRPAPGYLLLLIGFRSLLDRAAPELQPAVEVFNSASEYWREKGVPFFTISCEPSSQIPGGCTETDALNGDSEQD